MKTGAEGQSVSPRQGTSPIRAAIRLALLAAPGLATSNLHAQTASAAGDQIEEVSVYGKAIHYRPDDQSTGTGLKMDVVDAPVAIAVLTDAMLKEADARTVYEAADFVPGLNKSGEGFGLAVLTLRGQRVTSPRINGINYSSDQFVDSFALERVEIVRGPATVLYGVTGAFGGEVNQQLKAPQSEFHFDLGVQDGDFTGRRVQADVTGAIPGTDGKLKARVVGAYTNYGTFQDLVVPAHNIDKLLSAAVEYDFTPQTSVSVYSYKGDRNFDPTDGCPLAYDATTNRLYFPSSIAPEHYYCGDPKQNRVRNTDEFTIGSVKHSFDAEGWYTAANAAYAKSATPLKYVYGYGQAGYGLPPEDTYVLSYNRRLDRRTLTANASLGGRFELLQRTQEFFAALEYQKEDDKTANYVSHGFGLLNMFQDGGQGILADGTPIPPIPETPLSNVRPSEAKEVRGSFQLLLNPLERWDVLLGLLVQHTNQKNVVYWYTPALPDTLATVDQTDVVKRAAVTYGAWQDKGAAASLGKLYASYSEGFEPNIGVFDANGVALTDPQRMKSYEIGMKTQWFSARVDGDLAIYHATRTKIPVSNPEVNGTGTFSTTTLGGQNSYDGLEFQFIGELQPGWNVSLNYTFTRNRQRTLVISDPLAVANVPKHDIGLLTSYEFISGPLKGLLGGVSVSRKVDAPLVDNANDFANYGLDPHDQVLVSGTTVGFRFSYKGLAGYLPGLEIYGNLNNAFNARFPYSINGTSLYTITYMAPRNANVGINYHF